MSVANIAYMNQVNSINPVNTSSSVRNTPNNAEASSNAFNAAYASQVASANPASANLRPENAAQVGNRTPPANPANAASPAIRSTQNDASNANVNVSPNVPGTDSSSSNLVQHPAATYANLDGDVAEISRRALELALMNRTEPTADTENPHNVPIQLFSAPGPNESWDSVDFAPPVPFSNVPPSTGLATTVDNLIFSNTPAADTAITADVPEASVNNYIDLSNLQADLSNLQADLSNPQADLTNLQANLSNLQAGLASLQEDLANLQVDGTDFGIASAYEQTADAPAVAADVNLAESANVQSYAPAVTDADLGEIADTQYYAPVAADVEPVETANVQNYAPVAADVEPVNTANVQNYAPAETANVQNYATAVPDSVVAAYMQNYTPYVTTTPAAPTAPAQAADTQYYAPAAATTAPAQTADTQYYAPLVADPADTQYYSPIAADTNQGVPDIQRYEPVRAEGNVGRVDSTQSYEASRAEYVPGEVGSTQNQQQDDEFFREDNAFGIGMMESDSTNESAGAELNLGGIGNAQNQNNEAATENNPREPESVNGQVAGATFTDGNTAETANARF